MLAIQIVLIIFLVFALTRVLLRFRGSQLGVLEFLFWLLIFAGAAVGVIFPHATTRIANLLGIGRGADFVIYGAIVTLLYLVFRIYVVIEDVRGEITELVRKLAIRELEQKRK